MPKERNDSAFSPEVVRVAPGATTTCSLPPCASPLGYRSRFDPQRVAPAAGVDPHAKILTARVDNNNVVSTAGVEDQLRRRQRGGEDALASAADLDPVTPANHIPDLASRRARDGARNAVGVQRKQLDSTCFIVRREEQPAFERREIRRRSASRSRPLIGDHPSTGRRSIAAPQLRSMPAVIELEVQLAAHVGQPNFRTVEGLAIHREYDHWAKFPSQHEAVPRRVPSVRHSP